jgi:predicted nucleotidyltransferase
MVTIKNQTEINAKIKVPGEQIVAFCRRHQIRWLAFFGSVLRDDFRPDSDVDVLIDFEPEAEPGLIGFISMMQELSNLLQHPVDLVLRDGLKPRIRDSVLNSAEVIYAA